MNSASRQTNSCGFTWCSTIFVAVATALAGLAVVHSSALAADLQWDGGGANPNWLDLRFEGFPPQVVTNWSPETLPMASDNVHFTGSFGSGTEIQLNGDQTVQSLTIGTNTPFSLNNGTLLLGSGHIFRDTTVSTEHVFNNNVLLNSNAVWDIDGNIFPLAFPNSGDRLVVNGMISGNASLTKTGGSFLFLTNQNVYTGGTNIEGGYVRLSHGNGLGTGDVTISGSALDGGDAGALLLENNISVPNDITLNSITLGGHVINNLSGTNTIAGTTNLQIVSFIGALGGTLVFDGPLDGSGQFVSNSGRIRLAAPAAPTRTGDVRLRGGTLELGHDDALGTAAFRFEGNTALEAVGGARTIANNVNFFFTGNFVFQGQHDITMNGAMSFNSNLSAPSVLFINNDLTTFNGNMTGNAIAGKAGSGTLVLNGNNSGRSGATEITGGTLLVNNTAGSGTGSGAVTVQNGGTLGGDGSIGGSLTVNAGGVLAPGSSAGSLEVGGNYTSSAGVLEIELAGAGAGQFDELLVSGAASLDGTLDVELVGGFSPALNDMFPIISATGGVSGVFDTLAGELPALNGGLAWEIVYGTHDVVLSVVEASVNGDYNRDGNVDAADYVVWRKTFGQMGSGLPADGDSDDEIGSGDYDVWQRDFGASAGSGAAGAVPEPAALTLLATCLILLSRRAARRVA